MQYDAIVIGSGFGGSVMALRLAERGLRVGVLEQGRRIGPEDMLRGRESLRQLLWAPRLGLRGYYSQTVLRHVGIVGGVGVGGGSLVYAGVLLEPESGLFRGPPWSEIGVDWAAELAPHYATAARMLGRDQRQPDGLQDEALRETARALGAASRYGPAPLGIYFGEPGVTRPDPYFDGAGPSRTGCRLCGGCIGVGCPHGAKNSLDRNYLYLAEARGAAIHPVTEARLIRPLAGGGYAVETAEPGSGRPLGVFEAPRVVLAAGVLGSVALLSRSRGAGALAQLSPRLGEDVRTNSEAIVGILADDPEVDLRRGPGISSHFYLDDGTHITNNRFDAGQAFMKLLATPMVDDARPRRRAVRTAAAMVRHARTLGRVWTTRRWHERLTLLTVMQDVDSKLALRWRRGRLASEPDGPLPPSYLPQANRAARAYAEAIGGWPFNIAPESLGGVSVTAHILGGACIARDARAGVIGADHQVHGYPGLYVVDGAAVPGNVGVNPSLTITAMAERAAASIG